MVIGSAHRIVAGDIVWEWEGRGGGQRSGIV